MTVPPPRPDDLSDCLRAVALRQDRAAFGRLFQHFAPRIAAFLRRGGMGAEEAEDLAQETMAAVWRKAALFDAGRAGVATWIFTIARNQRIDHFRRATRALGAAELFGAVDESPAPSAEDLGLAGEREARVRGALARLSSEQAAVLRLSFFAEKPHGEIARELGIPLGTVKSRVRLAMARLRSFLEDRP
ncbi:MAG: sigma-70 family RNA polymerase sigma factor [Sphingomonadales bacterium]|nr:sigma-70 family RNA polymerase sigma factor [Sphingomonadales bacterium]